MFGTDFLLSCRSSEGNAPTQELKLPFCSNAGASLPISSLVSNTPGSTEVPKLICCSECTDHFNMEYNQIRVQESAKASTVRKQSSTVDEVVVSSLPSWLQKGKDMKTEQVCLIRCVQRLSHIFRLEPTIFIINSNNNNNNNINNSYINNKIT